ncbi:hypothetical protein ABEF92_004770 [Exophiala dermatitidis]|uniref:Transcription factor BYE1 n=1 Tax=Exophiala dermatitidis (strain ATCC 34100 / CBS 525.76 / NIH/UT8656) TaxID=858893 RepID=H6C3A2_EXODN|nr:uncharacterized protein HMPREF1120_06135 [Exophiala dermatitidis NIH/UT8656]EHY58117.1 hypothetical protein HMPREF1120_06135 [Exophiala dermatitidis NIH/UT8656]
MYYDARSDADFATDEPRRSGRATKGQHTKDRDVAEDTPAKKRGGRAKGSKAKAAEPEEQGEIIRCVCGTYEEEEDVPRAMICCDRCSAWQHNSCMGLPEDYEVDTYFCEQCKPENHKPLLQAIARGEKPWEEATRQREAEKARKKGGRKGGRKSGGPRASEVTSHASPEAEDTTPQAPATGQKRKLEDSPSMPELKNKKVRGTPAAEANGSKAATPAHKPSHSETPSRHASRSESVSAVVSDVKELANAARKQAASTLVKLIEQQIKDAVKQGEYAVPAGSNASDIANDLGLGLEHALYQVQVGGNGDPNEAYKAQLRSITFNVKKNHALGLRLLKGELTPRMLAAMDPKDMASEEQKRKDAAVIKELEKQHTIVEEEGPRIRRTHKGEEYVDESRQVAAESETSNAPVRKPSVADQEIEPKSPVVKTPSEATSGDPGRGSISQSRPSTATDSARKQSASNFDINKVWSNVQGSPDGEGQQRFGELPQQSPGVAIREPVGPGAKADADIDELLKDEDAESPPYSPKADTSAADGVVWRGVVNGNSLGRFHATARYAAGATPDCDTLRMTYSQLIPAEISIGGRIQPARADEYLCGLEYSSSSDLVIVWMPEPQNSHDQEQFDRLFRYFRTKDRFGVGIQHQNPAIKDIYLIPLEAGQELPTWVKKLETDFPDPARERMFLIPIVIKNSELPHNMAASMADGSNQSPSVQGSLVAQTPITPHEATFDQSGQQTYHNAYGQQAPMSGAPSGGSANGTPAHMVPPPGQAHPYPHPVTPHPQTFPTPTGASAASGSLQYATPQSYQPQQQSQPPPPPPVSMANAQKVLGPLASTPAVVHLCWQVPTAGENEFKVIKECLEKNPEAGKSLEALTAMLQHFTGPSSATATTDTSSSNANTAVKPGGRSVSTAADTGSSTVSSGPV